jgi:hypothetical protein
MPGAVGRCLAEPQFDLATWSHGLRPHTPGSVFVPIPRQLLTALLEGTLTVPTVPVPQPQDATWFDGSPILDTVLTATTNAHTTRSSASDENAAVGNEDSDSFPQGLDHLVRIIDAAIARLGGAVSPKLGDRSPTDAAWVSFHRSTRCESASEVLMLISASERVMRHAEGETSLILAMRGWIDGIDKSTEYRVFIWQNEIVGLSQRDPSVGSVLSDFEMDRTVLQVRSQFETVIQPFVLSLVDTSRADNYVYDVFVDRSWRVWIVDFAAWGAPTDSLLYEWSELEEHPWMSGPSSRAQLRCISAESAIRPSQTMYDGVPIELRSATSGEALVEAARHLVLRDDPD